VLVGVDHHCGATDAIALAKQLSAEGATLTLAHVYAGDPYVYRGVSAEYEASVRRQDLEFLPTVRAANGLEGPTRWRQADSVGAGLHELCNEVEADLLVVATSSRRHFGRVLPGDDARGAARRRAVRGSRSRLPVTATAPPGMRKIGVAYDGSPESDGAMAWRGISRRHVAAISPRSM
jgi:nucleotide-binding universal stress UspA family protein